MNLLARCEKSHKEFFNEYRDKLLQIYSGTPKLKIRGGYNSDGSFEGQWHEKVTDGDLFGLSLSPSFPWVT